MKIKALRSLAFAAALLAGCQQTFAAGMTIGDKAPALDVGEYISLGKERFKPVTKFQPGKVYVVEFWATWCGPCIAMMPHMAELQEKYIDQGLQFVSISDETREDIDKLMQKEAPNATGEDKTYADITSHYTVGTDTDGSVQKDYMEATRQNGIPTAFIVGKDGRLEWVGHPGEIEEPLEAVLQGKWDRDAFKVEFDDKQRIKDLDEDIQQVANKLKAKEINAEFVAAVLPVIEKYEREIKSEAVQQDLQGTKLNLLLTGDTLSDKTTALFASIMKNEKVSPVFKHNMAWKAYELSMESDKINKPLLQAAVDAIPGMIENLSEGSRPTVLDTLAHLQHRLGDNKAALATAEQAYKLSHEAPEYLTFIKQLKEEQK